MDKAKREVGGGRIGWLREHLILHAYVGYQSSIIFLYLNFWSTKDKCQMLEILPFILYTCHYSLSLSIWSNIQVICFIFLLFV